MADEPGALETIVIDIKMDKDAAEFALKVLNDAGYADAESQRAIEALANALANASKAYNPHEDFGSHYTFAQGENLAGNGTTDGLPSSTNEEAAESLK